ncbi:ATP-binding protein [Hymenobacter rubidus]|uniref:ATP-binding protein n=1 Tax=Hymenobacter rubidus TaxID=1441626 RepID=UPI00191F4BF3|nr:hybrid sensor histidine kinase/response regulator [Hymenobacter rubidus]
MKLILLIDDNPEDRMLYRRFLGHNSGFERLEIIEASSGDEGLELFKVQQPDCVLLDYNLPDTDGLAMLEAFGKLVPLETLCVVMITGGGSEALAVRALNNGALDYLVKQQFDRELLNKTVQHAIEKNEWRQYVARYHGELQGVNRQLRESLAELTEIRQELHDKNAQLSAANREIGARNQQLARTNQDLDNFVYAASHDLRQPVNNLCGLFDELRRTATFHDPEEAVVLRLVEESLHNLSTTITDLAAVVQEQRSPGEQAVEQVNFAGLAADVLQALRPQLLATDARFETEFEALPELQYVRSNLRTILLNLLSNALKYRHPDRAPHVQVRTYRVGDCPVLEVKDNGLGMNLDRYGSELFHLFRRFHPQAGEGTGVGLFLVNRLVQSQGGHIAVESQEGRGTTFRVYLHDGRGCAPSAAMAASAQQLA